MSFLFPRSPRSTRRVTTRTAVALLAVLPLTVAAGQGAGNVRVIVDVCQATGSDSNPYTFQTVSGNSIDEIVEQLGRGRADHRWGSAGSWNGTPHEAGDPKRDYVNVHDPEFSGEAWCLAKVVPLTSSVSIAKYVATSATPAASCPGAGWGETTEVGVGDDVDWCVRVANTGQTELTGVTITDVLGSATTALDASDCGVAFSTLAVGSDPVICLYTTTAVTGPQTNTATVDSAETTPVSDTAGYTTASSSTSSASIAKYVATSATPAASCPGAGWGETTEVGVGDDVDWCVRVANTGQTELTGVTITDVLGSATTALDASDCGVAFSTLAVGSDPVICLYTTTAVTGPQTNTATVDSAETAPVSDTAGYTTTSTGTTSVAIEKYVSVSPTRAASCPGAGWSDADEEALAVTTGDTVYWCVAVTNTGSERLTGIQLRDAIDDNDPVRLDEAAACGGPVSTLDAGSAPVICRYSTQAEQGPHVNTVTVRTAQTEDASAIAKYDATTPTPSVSVAKYAAPGSPVNDCPGTGWSDAVTVDVTIGSAVAWCVVVTNTGEVPLSDVEITDVMGAVTRVLGTDECGPDFDELAVGNTTITCRYSTLATAGSHTNTVTVETAETGPASDIARYRGVLASSRNMDGGSQDVPATVVVEPAISIVQSVDGDAYDVGDTITYTYVVTNTGETTLTALSLRDGFGSLTSSLEVRTLEPGQSTAVEVSEEALFEHVPSYTNVAVASGMSEDVGRIEAEDATTVEVSEVLGIVIDNPAPQAPAPAPRPAGPAPAPLPAPVPVATPVAAPVPAAELPRTGTDPGPAAALALALLVLGAALVRRQQPE